MKTIALAFRYLWSRPLAALLNLLLLTLGLASITFVLLVGEQLGRSFQRDLEGIDVVVGAKGSPMQLILAGVFHIDAPTGNIPLADVQALAKQPAVAKLIPLSLGDAFRGFRIVGTTPEYLRHYRMRFAQGGEWTKPMEAVLGAEAAAATGMRVGDTFVGNHGLAGGGDSHAAHPFRVVGVMAACGCTLDRLIVTSTETVWQVHEKEMAMDEEDRKALEAEREVTVALIAYRTPLAAVTFPRYVNSETGMQAAAPAVEVTRLLRLLGVGSEVLRGIGAVLLLSAALSVFVALWSAVRERRADIAMLRMLGASRSKVAALLVAEAFWLALIASVLGLALGHGLVDLLGSVLRAQGSLPVSGAFWLPQELWVPGLAFAVAAVAALIPAVSAWRTDVAHLLNTR